MNRPRLKALRKGAARWLRIAAGRVYPEPLHTIQVNTPEQTRTFIDCRELDAHIREAMRRGMRDARHAESISRVFERL